MSYSHEELMEFIAQADEAQAARLAAEPHPELTDEEYVEELRIFNAEADMAAACRDEAAAAFPPVLTEDEYWYELALFNQEADIAAARLAEADFDEAVDEDDYSMEELLDFIAQGDAAAAALAAERAAEGGELEVAEPANYVFVVVYYYLDQ